MIYTLTMNPSIDYVVECSDFVAGKLNRASKETYLPGGKGINVSMVLNHLGVANKAIFFSAGFTGDELESLLKKENVDFIALPASQGLTRVNVKVKGEKETEINASGPYISENDLKNLYETLGKLAPDDYLILSGNLPRGVDSEFYGELCRYGMQKGAKVVIDATKDALTKALEYKPFLIKPNLLELEEVFNVNITTLDETEIYAKKLRQMGARNICVSLGGDGAFLLTENDEKIFVPAYKGKVIGTVGAGDSLLAGFIAGYIESGLYEEALKLGVAAGSATAFSDKLAEKNDIFALIDGK